MAYGVELQAHVLIGMYLVMFCIAGACVSWVCWHIDRSESRIIKAIEQLRKDHP